MCVLGAGLTEPIAEPRLTTLLAAGDNEETGQGSKALSAQLTPLHRRERMGWGSCNKGVLGEDWLTLCEVAVGHQALALDAVKVYCPHTRWHRQSCVECRQWHIMCLCGGPLLRDCASGPKAGGDQDGLEPSFAQRPLLFPLQMGKHLGNPKCRRCSQQCRAGLDDLLLAGLVLFRAGHGVVRQGEKRREEHARYATIGTRARAHRRDLLVPALPPRHGVQEAAGEAAQLADGGRHCRCRRGIHHLPDRVCQGERRAYLALAAAHYRFVFRRLKHNLPSHKVQSRRVQYRL